MPTQIHNPRLSTRERYFARQATQRLASKTKFTEVLTAPWMGWVPDLPTHIVGWIGYRYGRGFMPFPYENRGMCLRHDDGYERNGTPMPLGDTVARVSGVTASETPGQFAITMIGQYFNALGVPQRIAIVAGDNSPVASGVAAVFITMYRQDPASGIWDDGRGIGPEVAPDGAMTAPTCNREALWDFCTFPFGAPTRATAINGPLMVMCSSNQSGPVSNVLVTPNDVGAWEYDDLCLAANPGARAFQAVSCATFGGRVHFLDTNESATHWSTRHRWTAIGTADPDDTLIGAGWLDLTDFERGGKRILPMQDKLVLYFGDGAAFQVPTGLYSDAYRPQIISHSRGLLASRAVCAISPHLHFGIFTDGWYTLDSSGRWSKLGRIILEESSGKSHELTKWEESFYEDLDAEQKHRIVCEYDRFREVVRIAYPSKSTNSENYTILNYHLRTDTCWQDRYSTPTTYFSILDLQQTVGVVWGDPPAPPASLPGTWADQTITWNELAARYKEEVLVHGNGPTVQSEWNGLAAPNDDWLAGYTTDGGLIFNRNPFIYTYDGANALLEYISHEVNRNQNPLLGQTFHRFGIEYIRSVVTGAMSVVVTTDEGGEYQTQLFQLNEGQLNTLQTAYGHYRLHGNEHGFRIYSFAPLMIRSLVPEIMVYEHDERDGQV